MINLTIGKAIVAERRNGRTCKDCCFYKTDRIVGKFECSDIFRCNMGASYRIENEDIIYKIVDYKSKEHKHGFC